MMKNGKKNIKMREQKWGLGCKPLFLFACARSFTLSFPLSLSLSLSRTHTPFRSHSRSGSRFHRLSRVYALSLVLSLFISRFFAVVSSRVRALDKNFGVVSVYATVVV